MKQDRHAHTLFTMAPRRKQTSSYDMQNGSGYVPVFRLQRMQRGSGFGGIFKSLLKVAMPMVKKGLLHVGKTALTAGAKALQDVSENKSTEKQAFKTHALEAFHPKNYINMSGTKRKSNTPIKPSKKKVKRIARNSGRLIAPSL